MCGGDTVHAYVVCTVTWYSIWYLYYYTSRHTAEGGLVASEADESLILVQFALF